MSSLISPTPVTRVRKSAAEFWNELRPPLEPLYANDLRQGKCRWDPQPGTKKGRPRIGETQERPGAVVGSYIVGCRQAVSAVVDGFLTAARGSDRTASLPLQLRTPSPCPEIRHRNADSGDAGRTDHTPSFLPGRLLFAHRSGTITCSGSSGRSSARRRLRGARLSTGRATHGRVTTPNGGSTPASRTNVTLRATA